MLDETITAQHRILQNPYIHTSVFIHLLTCKYKNLCLMKYLLDMNVISNDNTFLIVNTVLTF